MKATIDKLKIQLVALVNPDNYTQNDKESIMHAHDSLLKNLSSSDQLSIKSHTSPVQYINTLIKFTAKHLNPRWMIHKTITNNEEEQNIETELKLYYNIAKVSKILVLFYKSLGKISICEK